MDPILPIVLLRSSGPTRARDSAFQNRDRCTVVVISSVWQNASLIKTD